MTKKQAIKMAKKLSKERMNSEWFVVYDVSYDELYGKDQSWSVCDVYDLYTFYATETPVYSTKD